MGNRGCKLYLCCISRGDADVRNYNVSTGRLAIYWEKHNVPHIEESESFFIVKMASLDPAISQMMVSTYQVLVWSDYYMRLISKYTS